MLCVFRSFLQYYLPVGGSIVIDKRFNMMFNQILALLSFHPKHSWYPYVYKVNKGVPYL
jgi:hypothetical protein